MASYPQTIAIDSFFAPSTLMGDFLSSGDSFNAASARWSKRLAAPRARGGEARERFFEALAAYNRHIGVADDIVERLGEAKSGRSTVVITGQQPGVLGGPLMTLYKIETAIALATRLETDYGVRCVPVYWMGADDTDFAEIRELVLMNESHRTLATALPSNAHQVAMPVGNIEARWIAGLWDGLEAFVGGFPGSAHVVEAVGAALEASPDHAEATARIVAAITGGAVAIVDARAGELREAARDHILRFFDDEGDIRSMVESAGRELESRGYHAQLSLGPDSGVFVLEDGRRRKVTPESRAEVRGRLDSDVSMASPGVVLRNLVQDVVFDPVAVVLGPAEVAYREQIRCVYEHLGVDLPVSFPRLFATFVPPEVATMLEDVDGDIGVLLGSPSEFVAGAYASQGDDTLDAARRRLESVFDAELATFLSALDGRLPSPAVAKMKKRLADVRRRLTQASGGVADAGKVHALERWPFLETIGEAFIRKGASQERYLTMLAPTLFGGEGARAAVRAAAKRHVDAAMDARVGHVVYSV